MKLYLLAATALVAAPVYAQTTGTPSTDSGAMQTTPPTGQTGTTTTDPTTAPPTDPMTPPPSDPATTAPADPATTAPTDPAATGTTDPAATGAAGSTMQSTTNDPAMSSQPGAAGMAPDSTGAMAGSGVAPAPGGMMGGAGIAPQPVAAPEAANPNPPVCRSGQYDDCVQASGRRGSRARRRR